MKDDGCGTEIWNPHAAENIQISQNEDECVCRLEIFSKSYKKWKQSNFRRINILNAFIKGQLWFYVNTGTEHTHKQTIHELDSCWEWGSSEIQVSSSLLSLLIIGSCF